MTATTAALRKWPEVAGIYFRNQELLLPTRRGFEDRPDSRRDERQGGAEPGGAPQVVPAVPFHGSLVTGGWDLAPRPYPQREVCVQQRRICFQPAKKDAHLQSCTTDPPFSSGRECRDSPLLHAHVERSASSSCGWPR